MATQSRGQTDECHGSDRLPFLAALATTAFGLTAMSLSDEQHAAMEKVASIPKVFDVNDDQIHPNNYPPARPDLPTYSMEEVAEHADEDSLWYTFR
jgi:hypothetical protein